MTTDNRTTEGKMLEQGKRDRQLHYETRGHRYEEGRYSTAFRQLYLHIRNATLRQIILKNFPSGEVSVLEVGCGTGLTLEFLGRTSARFELFGTDISQVMIDQAASRLAALDTAPTITLGSAFRLPYDNSAFDVVYSTRFIHQFTHQEKKVLYGEFHRVVRPNGLIVTEFYGNRKARARRNNERYQEKFPTVSEVRDIVGSSSQIAPLTFRCGQRLFSWFGPCPVRWITRALTWFPFRPLINDQMVVTRSR